MKKYMTDNLVLENLPIQKNTENISINKKLDKPLVSIIMTTHNSSKYLEYSVDSLLRQNYTNIEIIIIDDFSKDNTQEIIKNLANIVKRIKYHLNSDNYGTYISKNIGILKSKGDFVTFHDSDDYSTTNRIQTQARFLNNNLNYDACTCGFISRSKKTLISAEITLFLRKSTLKKIGFFDSVRVGADTELRRRLMKGNLKIYYIKKFMYSCFDRLMEGNHVLKIHL